MNRFWSDTKSLIGWSFTEFSDYSIRLFLRDLFVGFTIALLVIPQGMAYSLVANVPITAGLLSAVFGTIFAALLGSSRHLVVGPTNSVAILICSGTAQILSLHYRDLEPLDRSLMGIQILSGLALFAGLIQISASLLKFGRLTHFVSRSVVSAYVAGVALTVIIGQSSTLLGIDNSSLGDSALEKLFCLLSHLGSMHEQTTYVGVGSLLGLILLNRFFPKVPNGIVIILITACSVYLMGYSPLPTPVTEQALGSGDRFLIVGDMGTITAFTPQFQIPFFNLRVLSSLLPIAFAIAAVGILESTSIAKSIADRCGHRVALNREILGLGVSNVAAACLGAMPGSGSPSRSFCNYSLGATTRISAISSGLFVLLILMVFWQWVVYIPLATLAALLLSVGMTRMVDVSQLVICYKATKADRQVLILTLVASLIFSLDIALYIGIGASISLYLRQAAHPSLLEQHVDAGKVLAGPPPSKSNAIRVIDFEGELFFGSTEALQKSFRKVSADPATRVVILRLDKARNLDASACMALGQLHEQLKRSGRHLIGCALNEQAWQALNDSGVANRLGEKNFFMGGKQGSEQALQKALSRAEELLEIK